MSHRAALSGPLSMRIAIVGGTGTVGAEAARELERRGHAVRVLSRHAPEHAVDLRDGSGLAAALDGVDVVVNAANGKRKRARGRHGATAARRQGGRGASLRRRLYRRHRPRRHRLLQGQARAGGADPALGRPLDDRARDAVPPVPGAHVRDQREARHRALPEVPDAAGRSARGRPRAGRDGRGRAVADDHAVRRPGGGERLRAGPALAAADRLARAARAPARDPRAALGRADEPGGEARQRTFDPWLEAA